MPKRLRVVDGSREWIAELSTSGVALSNVDGSFAVSDDGDGRFHVAAASAVVTAIAAAGGGDVVWVGIDVRPDSGASTSAARDQDALSPPMSATVVRILVQPGARVQAGETLVVLEAMKMELPIRAPRAAAIRAVHCREGDLVQPGMALVELA